MKMRNLGIVLLAGAASAQGDSPSYDNAGPMSFYTENAPACEGCKTPSFSSTHPHSGLSDAIGDVVFSVQSWGNFANDAYVHVTVNVGLRGHYPTA